MLFIIITIFTFHVCNDRLKTHENVICFEISR